MHSPFGYTNYAILLFLITGLTVLYTDVKSYRKDNLKREEKASHLIGWFNTCLAAVVFLANWVYSTWFW